MKIKTLFKNQNLLKFYFNLFIFNSYGRIKNVNIPIQKIQMETYNQILISIKVNIIFKKINISIYSANILLYQRVIF